MPVTPVRLFPTEVAARKAGQHLDSAEGGRHSAILYALLPRDQKKPLYLVSTTERLSRAEQSWVAEHAATVTKLGRFHLGGFVALQTRMVRSRQPPG